MAEKLITLPSTVQAEFNDLLIGKHLGTGTFRAVYELAVDPTKVVKIETSASLEFENVSEWVLWNELKSTKWAAFLAPCFSISHSGSVLIQARTRPITKLPAELPSFMTDLKLRNFGRLGRRTVAHDYGHHRAFFMATRATKLKPVFNREADWG